MQSAQGANSVTSASILPDLTRYPQSGQAQEKKKKETMRWMGWDGMDGMDGRTEPYYLPPVYGIVYLTYLT